MKRGSTLSKFGKPKRKTGAVMPLQCCGGLQIISAVNQIVSMSEGTGKSICTVPKIDSPVKQKT